LEGERYGDVGGHVQVAEEGEQADVASRRRRGHTGHCCGQESDRNGGSSGGSEWPEPGLGRSLSEHDEEQPEGGARGDGAGNEDQVG